MKMTNSSTFLCAGLLIMSIFSMMGYAKDKEQPNIRLESNFIGDKEQPSVSYFIPWQGIGTPDKLQWDLSDKTDKTLNRVDRNVFRRSLKIYDEMKLEQSTVNVK